MFLKKPSSATKTIVVSLRRTKPIRSKTWFKFFHSFLPRRRFRRKIMAIAENERTKLFRHNHHWSACRIAVWVARRLILATRMSPGVIAKCVVSRRDIYQDWTKRYSPRQEAKPKRQPVGDGIDYYYKVESNGRTVAFNKTVLTLVQCDNLILLSELLCIIMYRKI